MYLCICMELQASSYRDGTIFFSILFFILKCFIIYVKYLMKFGTKYV